MADPKINQVVDDTQCIKCNHNHVCKYKEFHNENVKNFCTTISVLGLDNVHISCPKYTELRVERTL